jgi:hypothetical protein
MVRENKGRSNGSSFLCGNVRNGNGCIRARWDCSDFETSFLSFVNEIDIASIINDDRGRGAELEHRIFALKGRLVELKGRQDQTFELMQKTRAVDYVARKLNELETERASIEVELRAAEAERAGLESSRLGLDEVRPLIEKLRGAGDDASRLRSAVASRLRSLVHTILVAPAGGAPLIQKTIDFLADQEGAEDVLEHARQRLEDERSGRRYFLVAFANGDMRGVFPDPDDPTRFTEQFTSSSEMGLVEEYPDHSEQIFPPRLTLEDLFPEHKR